PPGRGGRTAGSEPLRDNGASVTAVQEARVEDRGGGEIIVDVRDRRRFLRGADVLVEIRAPNGASVRAKSGSADVEGHGRFGSVHVESGSGDVQFSEIAGEAEASSARGGVQISSGGGDCRISTAPAGIQPGAVPG